MPQASSTEMDVTLTLDRALVAKASAVGPLGGVVERALRNALDPAAVARHRRWAEDNALLIEALAGGAEEIAVR